MPQGLLLSRWLDITCLYISTALAYEKAGVMPWVLKYALIYVHVRTVPESWSHDCESGAPCCTASLGRYFSDEWSQWHGVCKRSLGLWQILPIDHTHIAVLLRSLTYEKKMKLSPSLPSGPFSFPKPLNDFSSNFRFPVIFMVYMWSNKDL